MAKKQPEPESKPVAIKYNRGLKLQAPKIDLCALTELVAEAHRRELPLDSEVFVMTMPILGSGRPESYIHISAPTQERPA